jgi:hypothetical protein
MNYYFLNTDAKSLRGDRRFPILIRRGFAATGGSERYGRTLAKLREDDILLLYEKKLGVVAVGRVRQRWDGKAHATPRYYVAGKSFKIGQEYEYRIPVEWFLDLSDNPIPFAVLHRLTGSTPSATLKKINKRAAVQRMIDKRREPLASPGSQAQDLDAPPAERVQTTVSRIVRDTWRTNRVKRLHNYKCQICGEGIILADGSAYAEGHHLQPLGRDGPDVDENIICVCPNHHAACDFGAIPLRVEELRRVKEHLIGKRYIEYHNRVIYRGDVRAEEKKRGRSSIDISMSPRRCGT